MPIADSTFPSEHVLCIGPRELDVLRLVWEHGPASARQLHTKLVADPPISYSTVQTICVHLATKGLLTRRPAPELRGIPISTSRQSARPRLPMLWSGAPGGRLPLTEPIRASLPVHRRI